MLRELSIKNFAIIDDLRIRFSEGLTILSGETGAGKSIIINAVNLLLGSRATASFVRTGAENAELEALFETEPNSPTARTLAENDLEDSQLLIRRIINRNNRHRIYINDRLATMTLLSAITKNLASISGQHAHQGLLDENRHLLILDRFGNLMGLREDVRRLYMEIQPLIEELKNLESLKLHQFQQRELLSFQRSEIEQAGLHSAEDEKLEQELMRIKNSRILYQGVFGAVEELYTSENAVADRLTRIKKQMEKALPIDPSLEPRVRELSDILFQIEDLVGGLRSYLERIQTGEDRVEILEDRLDLIRKLKRKYGGTIESVLAHLESTEQKLSEMDNLSERIEETQNRLLSLQAALGRAAVKLSAERKKTGQDLSRKVEAELSFLKMANTRFEVFLDKIPVNTASSIYLTAHDGAITETGMDRAAFMIAPNVGEKLKPLSAIASGGELSRVILALKAILARTEFVGTIIFDEVDAGIGGSTAEIVGRKIADLSAVHQVICITHLAQIAKFGSHHFRIVKEVSNGRTSTAIYPLQAEDRILELARMLGGVKLTQATLEHAQEMFEDGMRGTV
jgi:DNA repair protein RecN (Recombination protein N)